MLAQNFKTAADLGLSDRQFEALLQVLGMLEREEIAHTARGNTISPDFVKSAPPVGFNMWAVYGETDCGTVCCICGWAEHVGRLPRGSLWAKSNMNRNLAGLFDPSGVDMVKVTPAQAAIALRSFLSTGDPCWSDAVR